MYPESSETWYIGRIIVGQKHIQSLFCAFNLRFSFLESAGSIADHYRDHYRFVTVFLCEC